MDFTVSTDHLRGPRLLFFAVWEGSSSTPTLTIPWLLALHGQQPMSAGGANGGLQISTRRLDRSLRCVTALYQQLLRDCHDEACTPPEPYSSCTFARFASSLLTK